MTLVLTEEEVAYILRRHRRLQIMQATIVVVIVLAVVWWLWLRPLPPLSVAVTEVQVESGLPTAMADTIRMAITGELSQLRQVYPLRAADVDAVGDDPDRIDRALAADEVINVFVSHGDRAGRCHIKLLRTTSRNGTASGRGFYVEPIAARDASLAAAADTLALFPQRCRPWTRANGIDYTSYAAICSRIDRGGAGKEILQELTGLTSRDGCPAEAYAMAVTVARELWQTTQAVDYLDHARRVLGEAPKHAAVTCAALELALAEGTIEHAEDLLDDLPSKYPRRWWYQSRIHHARGDTEQAIQAIYWALLDARTWNKYFALAKLYQQTGETELARQSLEAAHEYVPEYAAVSEELAKYDADPEQE